MKSALAAFKRLLRIRSQRNRGDAPFERRTNAEVVHGKDPDILCNTEDPAVQHSQAVKTSQSQQTREPLGAANSNSANSVSVKEEDGSAKQLATTSSAQTKSTNTEGNVLKATSILTESSGQCKVDRLKQTRLTAVYPLANAPSTDLVDRLSQAMKESAFKEDRSFIPDGELNKLVCRSTVRKELSSANQSQTSTWKRALDMKRDYKLASKICPRRGLKVTSKPIALSPLGHEQRFEYRRIFAILLLMNTGREITDLISDLVKCAVSDQKLPLVQRKVTNGDGMYFASHSEPNTALRCFDKWDKTALHKFEQLQWRVLAPVFNQSEHGDMLLNVACVLPFCKWTCYAQGESACIYMAEIHPQHNRLRGTGIHSDVFAVKHFLKPRNGNLPNEKDILKAIRKPHHQHEHLIDILATFCIDGMDYIVLPWAKFDLLKYWRYENPSPQPSRETVRWLLEQCHGLACALYNIHRWQTFDNSRLYNLARPQRAKYNDIVLLGQHGDIKPMNILWLNNGYKGILKLADFGAARFVAEGVPAPVNLDGQGTPGYRAPEFDSATETNSSWDIWALGCVYLEFVTWLSLGWTGVNDFAQTRLAYDPQHPSQRTTTFFEPREVDDNRIIEIKQVVHQHVKTLSPKTPYSMLQDFLKYIMEKMIIVPSETAQRSSATEVMQETEKLLNAFKKATNRGFQLKNFGENSHGYSIE